MSVRSATVLAGLAVTLAMTLAALSACHDGAHKHTETTQIRITGTPRAARGAPKPADTGSTPRSGVGPEQSPSQE